MERQARLCPYLQPWHACRMTRAASNETKSTDKAARDEILRERPDLRGKSLEAMRRILRREARLSLSKVLQSSLAGRRSGQAEAPSRGCSGWVGVSRGAQVVRAP
jgi:hypothetical protein